MIDSPEKRIDKNAITAWRTTGILFGLLWYSIPVIPIIAHINKDAPIWIVILSVIVAITLHIVVGYVFPVVRWKRWKYEVTEKGVDMLHGIIIRKRTMVPVNRIQHVDTKQGPIYRKFGLSALSISTAATTHEIPALDDETASELRTLISELVRQAREDV
ncbi:MAG: PH domain-containing protein [Balneolaceae bacterium]